MTNTGTTKHEQGDGQQEQHGGKPGQGGGPVVLRRKPLVACVREVPTAATATATVRVLRTGGPRGQAPDAG
jgi:hypothetical protein